MCIHPEIQQKAQELDRVIGKRLPTFEDRNSLPYVEAIYREVLRWNSPLLLGIPHYSSEDDHYKGYFIPKSTILHRKTFRGKLMWKKFRHYSDWKSMV